MSSITNQVPYLRTSRSFSLDANRLSQELSLSYIDTANAVNVRTIGIFSFKSPVITGNTYFLTSNKQQSLRQIYTFTSTSDIDLGFKITSIYQFIDMYGTFTDSTSAFGMIAGSSVAIAGQLSFYVDVNAGSTTSDVIKIVSGAGVPALTNGTIILEWIANVSS